MEKQIKQIEVSYGFAWNGLTEISEIEKDLEEIKKMGATHVEIETFEEWGDTYITTRAICEREETDEEFEARKFQEKLEAEKEQQRELALLNELKLKYEKMERIESGVR